MRRRSCNFSLANKTAASISIYEITVSSTRPDPGGISDVVYLDTDSPIRPTLQVTVSGTIISAKKDQP